jgi:ACS family hexuronate transporter-like MFS transporter
VKIPRLQWVIAFLLCLSTTINYLDRLAIGVVSVDIRHEFALNEQDYAHILTLFFLAYSIMYAGSGYIVDRLGTRKGFAVFVTGWSIAQLLHGFATGKWTLAGYRFLLGLTEPGAWPAAAKAVSEWFPASQRALGMGIFNAGTSLGSLLAPITVAVITLKYGWRNAFVFTGLVGLVWLAAWLFLYQPPHLNRWLRKDEYERLKPFVQPPAEARTAGKERVDWWALLRTRPCWTLVLTRFFTDPVIYFVIFWLPEYLRKERAFDLAMVGKYSWVPFAFGGIGYVTGGWLSGRLMHAGWTLPRARKFVMALGAAVMPLAMLAPFVPTAALAIAATCAITLGHGLWTANLQTIPTDIYRGHEIGTVTGFSGSGGAIGGMFASLGTGYLVTHFTYAPVFLLSGLMHPLSAVLTYLLLPNRFFTQTAKPHPTII